MKSAQRREQLLESAIGVFAKSGYRSATTAALAKAAGITEPILYRHFKSKQALFAALVEAVGAAVLSSWRKELDAATTPRARWHALLQANPATHARGRNAYRVIFSAMLEGRNDKLVAGALRAHLESLHEYLRGEVQQLQSQSVVNRQFSASDIAWALMDVAIGHGMRSGMHERKGKSVATETHRLRDMLERAFSVGPSEGRATRTSR